MFTLSILCTIRYCEQSGKWDLYLACGLFSLAFLAKSWHAGAIPLIMFSILASTGSLKRLRLRNWLSMFAFALLPAALWAALRIRYDGMAFFEGMFSYDLLARASTALEGHMEEDCYYLYYLISNWPRFIATLLCVLGGGMALAETAAAGNEQTLRKPIARGLFFWFVIPIVAISFVKTKLPWYLFPALIPLLASAAITLVKLIKRNRPAIIGIASLLALFLYLGNGVRLNIGYVKNQEIASPQQAFMDATLSRDADYAGKRCYFAENSGGWQQGDLLQAELSADFHCVNGGASAFAADPDGLLLANEKNLADVFPSGSAYIVLLENGGWLLLAHAK